MKKILILLICAVLALSLWGCGEEKDEGAVSLRQPLSKK